MPSFFWYQRTGGAEPWREALSDQRISIMETIKPAFVTVLDAFEVPDKETWGREDYNKMRYSGPFYVDFDADSIEDCIPSFHKFLKNLEDGGVNIKAPKLYATGGRGFHIEIPESMVNPKQTRNGVNLLPYIYRDIAEELVVDHLDLKVYTARMGRMWRCPSVERRTKDTNKPTGRYKVSISLEQAWAMTPDLYDTLTRTPCPEHPRAKPELSAMLSSLFVKSQMKLEKVRSRVTPKADLDALARFKGEWPATMAKVMGGINVAPGKGFNQIATQLAIAAVALCKSEEQLVEACEGLVHGHSSDSSRYNSPRKRKEELRRMWQYMSDSSIYEFSIGGLKSLLAAGVDAPDLDPPGLSNVGTLQGEDEENSVEIQEMVDSSSRAILEGLLIVRAGIFQRKSDGAKPLSTVSFSKPVRLVDSEDYLQVGMEANVVSEKIDQGRQLISMQTFASRKALNDFCLARGSVFNGTDSQASVTLLILTRSAIIENNTTYIVRKEGLDIIQNPLTRDRPDKHVIWSSPDCIEGHTEGVNYRFQSKVAGGAVFKTDLHLSNPMTDTPESKAWVHAMLTMNHPTVVGQMLGWFVSCFHKQMYQIAFDQFPLLHPNGTAGSGKTLTTKLLANMFWTMNPVRMMGASKQSSTDFSLKSAFTGSASIPLVIDEYKPSELANGRYEFLLQHFRMLYNQASGASGGINRGGAESSFRDITHYTYSAPTVYLGESQEMQTAIVQRTVAVGFKETETRKHTAAWEIASDNSNQHFASELGRTLMLRSLEETVQSRTDALNPVLKHLRSTMQKGTHDRQSYNLAVVLCGIDFVGNALQSIFGEEFDAQILVLRNSLLESKNELSAIAMAESSKVLNDMALISRTELADTEFCIREGQEFIVADGWMEMLVKEAFVKYFAWSNRKGFKPLYTTADGFINSLAKNPATLDTHCFDSKLRGGSMSKVFRLDLERLQAEGVEAFKTRARA